MTLASILATLSCAAPSPRTLKLATWRREQAARLSCHHRNRERRDS
jgi:hypothetical protein